MYGVGKGGSIFVQCTVYESGGEYICVYGVGRGGSIFECMVLGGSIYECMV